MSQDKSSSEKIYKVTDNGTYIFRITGNNGRRIKVSCTVTNAIPIKKDLLTAVADIEISGISKCKVIGKPGENLADEPVIYSLDTIIYDGNLILDGYSENIPGATLKSGKLYEFGDIRDVSDGNKYAENTVVLKVKGDLTVKEGVTLTSISNGYFGGPKGMIIYCTGSIINDGIISMSNRGAYAEGENVYLYKNSNNTYEFIPAIGALGGNRVNLDSLGFKYGEKGQDGINRSTGGGSGGSVYVSVVGTNCTSASGGVGTSYSGGSYGGFVVGPNSKGTYTCPSNTNFGFRVFTYNWSNNNFLLRDSLIVRGGGTLTIIGKSLSGSGALEAFGEVNSYGSESQGITSASYCGGGSINIFAYENIEIIENNINVKGGIPKFTDRNLAGSGTCTIRKNY